MFIDLHILHLTHHGLHFLLRFTAMNYGSLLKVFDLIYISVLQFASVAVDLVHFNVLRSFAVAFIWFTAHSTRTLWNSLKWCRSFHVVIACNWFQFGTVHIITVFSQCHLIGLSIVCHASHNNIMLLFVTFTDVAVTTGDPSRKFWSRLAHRCVIVTMKNHLNAIA